MDSAEFIRIPMDSIGFLWIPVDCRTPREPTKNSAEQLNRVCSDVGECHKLWIPMDSYGFLRIHMDSYGFIWIPMDSCGFLPRNTQRIPKGLSWTTETMFVVTSVDATSCGFLWIPHDSSKIPPGFLHDSSVFLQFSSRIYPGLLPDSSRIPPGFLPKIHQDSSRIHPWFPSHTICV